MFIVFCYSVHCFLGLCHVAIYRYFYFFFLLHEFGNWVACQLYTHFSALLRPLTHLTRYTNLPRSFSAMHFFQILNKASARHPATALLPSFCFHMRSKAFALSRLQRKSSSRFCGIFAAGISSFGPSSRQQVPRHHLCLRAAVLSTQRSLGRWRLLCAQKYIRFLA